MSNTLSIGTAQTLLHESERTLNSVMAPVGSFVHADVFDSNDKEIYAPGLPVVITNCTGTEATQVDPTIFNTGDSTIGALSLTPHLYMQRYGVSQTDLNSGVRIGSIGKKNALTLAEKITDVIMANVNVANYGAAVVTVDAVQFTQGDFDILLGSLSSSERVCILDTSYFVRVKSTWIPPGLEGRIYEISRWGSAGSKIHGAVLDPRALVAVSGVPVAPVGSGALARSMVTVPGINLVFEYASWLDVNARSLRSTLGGLFDCIPGDKNACKLLAGSTV